MLLNRSVDRTDTCNKVTVSGIKQNQYIVVLTIGFELLLPLILHVQYVFLNTFM